MADAALVAEWAARFEADRAAALAYRAELQRDGRPTDPDGQAKQLGLSVALTDPEFRCDHYGDRRHCPFCAQESVTAEQAATQQQAREDKHGRELSDARSTIERQSQALDDAHATIQALNRRVARMAQQKRSLFRR